MKKLAAKQTDPIKADGKEYDLNKLLYEGENGTYLAWPTNLLGLARVELQLAAITGVEEDSLMNRAGYTVIYCIGVILTVYFFFVYLKRVSYLAFFTLIAPLITLTYPIDKINDGKAQGFEFWMREYIFNLIMQPFHLILYVMLITSAIDLAKENLIYAWAAMAFIMIAESLLRQMFNYGKATTASPMAAVAGASFVGGLLMRGISGIKKKTANRDAEKPALRGSDDTNWENYNEGRTLSQEDMNTGGNNGVGGDDSNRRWSDLVSGGNGGGTQRF